jgi:hypothetical protein
MNELTKIIFLDIDGVLNSEESYKQIGTYKVFSPKSLNALERILKVSGAKIVISSAWRYSHTTQEMQDMLAGFGVTCEVIGETPSTGPIYFESDDTDIIQPIYPTRGKEIKAWLDENTHGPIHFVIIDDISDMDELSSHLVQTSFEKGLGPEHVGPALEKLDMVYESR